jgi:hypothetical protein
MTPRDVLEPIYGKDIADHLFDAYSEIESNYVYRKWKPSELDGGGISLRQFAAFLSSSFPLGSTHHSMRSLGNSTTRP